MNRIFTILIVLCACATTLLAQRPQKFAGDYSVHFTSGIRQFPENVENFLSGPIPQGYQGQYVAYVQFYEIPQQAVQEQLAADGLLLLQYIPHKTYIVSFPNAYDRSRLRNFGVRSVVEIPWEDKVEQRLFERPFPKHVLHENGQIEVFVSYYENLTVPRRADAGNFPDLGPSLRRELVNPDEIAQLAARPEVQYLELPGEPGQPESNNGKGIHRSNTLGDLGFDGTGILVGVFDDGVIGPHIDFQGRATQTEPNGEDIGTHGDGVAGIIGSAGNLNPFYTGMAPGADLFIMRYNNCNSTTTNATWHQNNGVLIFNASYSDGCNGGYTNVARQVDQNCYNNPSLLQCYSGGNAGTQDCGYGAGAGWGNITGGHKASKNTIAAANLNENEDLESSSSRGPVHDGRLKPDIAAHGQNQISNDPNNGYQVFGGTSAASPGIAGVSAQLYQAFKSLNGGTNPTATLVKACLLNGADDYGNEGPDFKYGWGRVNGRRALQPIQNGQYMTGTLTQGASNTHSITVPAGLRQLKVMVLWADRAAAANAMVALINDLDMTGTSPGGTTELPWILDPTPNPANLDAPATHGDDTRNNMEQLVFDNPVAGNYVITVNGAVVPQGPQSYVLVYTFVENELKITYPNGGEGFSYVRGERICWDAPDNAGTFTLEYSTNNGASWNLISNNVAANRRQLLWFPPFTSTGQALVRVTRGGLSDVSDANFSICPEPGNLRVVSVCAPNTIIIGWNAVAGATEYDVFQLGSQYMDSIGTTNGLLFNVNVANLNDEQWFAVRAKGPNGLRSMRTVALRYAGGAGGACFLDCNSPDDAGVASVSPQGTVGACNPGGIPVVAQVHNIGTSPQSNFPVNYRLDNGTIITEIFTGTVDPGDTTSFTFNTLLTGLAVGNHSLQVWTSLANDLTTCNDSKTSSFNFINTPPGIIPYLEPFTLVTFPPTGWSIVNPDNATTWVRYNVTGANGLTTGAAGVDNYNYNAAGQTDVLNTYLVDLTLVNQPELRFDLAYAFYGVGYNDSLKVEISSDCGSTWNTLYNDGGVNMATTNNTGDWTPNAPTDWRMETFPLQAYIGQVVQFRFTNKTAYGNNLYIDNINVVETAVTPVANFNADILTPCPFEEVQLNDLSLNNPISWQWDFTPNTITYLNGTNANSQNPTVMFNNLGTYDIQLTVTNQFGTNSYTRTSYINAINGVQIPISETFAGFTVCPITNNCEVGVCNLGNGWKNAAPGVDQIDWRTYNSPTPTVNTGPTVDHTVGNLTGRYLYLEATPAVNGDCSQREAHLLSPCITLVGTASPQLSFWYHMYGVNMGSLHVDVLSNGAWIDDIMQPLSGNLGNAWNQAIVDISPYVGQIVQFRIRGITGNGEFSDMGIDDINISDVVGVLPVAEAGTLQIFPNPATDAATLMLPSDLSGEGTLHVFDTQGKLAQESFIGNLSVGSHRLSLEQLPAGVYAIRLLTNKGTWTGRLVVE